MKSKLLSIRHAKNLKLLDTALIEYVNALPDGHKLRGWSTKVVLKAACRDLLPPAIRARRKMGFGVPIDHWLRGPLKDWAEALIDPQRLKAEGYLNPVLVREKWIQHQSGRRNWSYYLWDVLMFQAWLAEQ